MHKALTDLPVFDPQAFRERTADWKKLIAHAKPGGDRIVVEWGVSRGPSCHVYPFAKREAGIDLTADTPHTQSDERWADFLEFEFVPHVLQALRDEGFKPTLICADLRPITIMRERRRTLEAIAHAKTGVTGH